VPPQCATVRRHYLPIRWKPFCISLGGVSQAPIVRAPRCTIALDHLKILQGYLAHNGWNIILSLAPLAILGSHEVEAKAQVVSRPPR